MLTQWNASVCFTLSWLLLLGVHLLVKSKAFQYTMCKWGWTFSLPLRRCWDNHLPSSVPDAVVAINGVWILLETYTLNSAVSCSLWTQMLKENILRYRSVSCVLLQMDFLGPKLFPGVTLSFWQVRPLLAMFLSHPYLSTVRLLETAEWWMNSAEASCLLPSSLWCRGVVEGFRPGAGGLFQLWVESVSDNLDSVSVDGLGSILDPCTRLTVCPGSTSLWQSLPSWVWSLLPSTWSPFILLWSSGRFSCSGKFFLTRLRSRATHVFYISKMQIYFSGCLRLSRGIVTCWTRCLSSSPGWQASVWP